MKAIVIEKIGGPEVMKIAEVPKPEVKPGTVLIKVRAAGINFADTLFRQGQYVMQPKFPDTPGFEGAGEIEAVGASVTNLRAGQRGGGDREQDVRRVRARAGGAGDCDSRGDELRGWRGVPDPG